VPSQRLSPVSARGLEQRLRRTQAQRVQRLGFEIAVQELAEQRRLLDRGVGRRQGLQTRQQRRLFVAGGV